jgi:hypothetical protein
MHGINVDKQEYFCRTGRFQDLSVAQYLKQVVSQMFISSSFI